MLTVLSWCWSVRQRSRLTREIQAMRTLRQGMLWFTTVITPSPLHSIFLYCTNEKRFSVGTTTTGVLQDPRLVSFKQLQPIGINKSPIKIPPNWLMAHQYLYIVHDQTDEKGWQYRSTWSEGWQVGPKDEPWTSTKTKTSAVR